MYKKHSTPWKCFLFSLLAKMLNDGQTRTLFYFIHFDHQIICIHSWELHFILKGTGITLNDICNNCSD